MLDMIDMNYIDLNILSIFCCLKYFYFDTHTANNLFNVVTVAFKCVRC